MSEVFGPERHPKYSIIRTDRLGRTTSIGDQLPQSKAVLFVGAPGTGVTDELNRAEDLALRKGWTAIRVSALKNRPIEYQLTNAVRENLGRLRKRFGRRAVHGLNKTVDDLTNRGTNRRWGFEVRLGGGVLPAEAVNKREWDATAHGNIGTTLIDFADRLGELARPDDPSQPDRPILLLVDNIDDAQERDRAGLNELAIHLEKMGKPVWLVAGGGLKSTATLMQASRRMSGIATTVTNQFDIRELRPLSDAELRPALTEPFRKAGLSYQPEAVTHLLEAANGDLRRLRELGVAAVGYAGARKNVTLADARNAAVWLEAEIETTYDSRWDQQAGTTTAQRKLLGRVAAEGPNGLHMPAVLRAAGEGEWQEIDQARQELVARGLLRDYEETVTIPEPGFQNWINNALGQTPAPARYPVAVQHSRPQAALAPAHEAGNYSLATQVFGKTGDLVHQIDRKDEKYGRPVSLDVRRPNRRSVLFTGPPGMGTSQELSRVKKLADQEGWVAFKLDASRSEALEARFHRAVKEQLGSMTDRCAPGDAKKLDKLVNKLAIETKRAMNTAQLRLGLAPLKIGVHGAWEDDQRKRWVGLRADTVGTTLTEVATHLATMATNSGKPVVLMVDNLDAASDWDLVTMTELSRHLQELGKPVFLVGAGGEEAESRLLDASAGAAGVEKLGAGRFEVRRLTPIPHAELRPALTVPLQAKGVRYDDNAVDTLVAASNGNPTRLRTLAGAALELTDSATGITPEIANRAMAQVNEQSRALYDAAWFTCTSDQKEVLARAAARGSAGIPRPAQTEPAESPKRFELDQAAQKLVSNGLLTRSGGEHHFKIADPGFQEWLQNRLGQHAAQTGVAAAGTLPPARTAAPATSAAAASTVADRAALRTAIQELLNRPLRSGPRAR
ncbi:hypothetical protein AB0E69_32925 [Kribbella sp. NPDC026611]|uniref:hypothetical protein n=1 Tax=Kribbella sp. NPDC026611 TaxID=3154911 RepID=UPI00340734A8